MNNEPNTAPLISAARSARIGIDITSANTQGGGIGRLTRELVWALVEVDHVNSYQLFSAKPSREPPVANVVPQAGNVRYIEAPLDERWLYRLWYRLRLPLPVQWMCGSLDLFHSPDFVLPPVTRGTPTLLTVHDLSFVHYPHTFPPKLVAYLNRVVPWSIDRATHVLADSHSTKKDLMETWHVPSGRISVLHGGVNDRFRPVKDQEQTANIRSKYGLEDSRYILSVGTLQPRKNYAMLIRAFRPIAADWPYKLVIAGGKGWLYDEMLSEVERQGLNGRVLFLGFVDDDDLPALYSEAELFVFPSLYEGFGLPLLEAMACGTPVISSNASSLPEVGLDPRGREVARLLPPQDEALWTETIDRLLNDRSERVKMAADGVRQAANFTWHPAAHKLVELYSWLLEEPTTFQA